jgi:transposase, IS30 family
MRSYRRVTYEERCQIKAYLDVDLSKTEIARRLGFHKSTISRELKRNAVGKFSAHKADKLARERFKSCCKPIKIKGDLKALVINKIQEKWSPEQISGRLSEQNIGVSREAIYRFIRKDKAASGELWKYLRRPPKSGQGRYLTRKYKPDWLLRLNERPDVVNKRERVGDWERDTMYAFKRESLLVCVERKTRFLKLGRLKNLRSHSIGVATINLLENQIVHTLTNDNGTEFRDYFMMKNPIYYCDPYKPQQRGTVENTIGLLRQYITNQTDLNLMTDEQIQQIENQMNDRPRKCLDYKTPREVLSRHRVALAI